MQQSGIVLWQQGTHESTKHRPERLPAAIDAAARHRASLRTIVGLPNENPLQVNVFALHVLGTAKNRNTLHVFCHIFLGSQLRSNQ